MNPERHAEVKRLHEAVMRLAPQFNLPWTEQWDELPEAEKDCLAAAIAEVFPETLYEQSDKHCGQYRKKPVVIEAAQWFKLGDHPNVTRSWSEGSDYRCPKCGQAWGKHGEIETLESKPDGAHHVCPGDWIITGVKGEHYACKPDIFEQTYEPATDTERVVEAERRRDVAERVLKMDYTPSHVAPKKDLIDAVHLLESCGFEIISPATPDSARSTTPQKPGETPRRWRVKEHGDDLITYWKSKPPHSNEYAAAEIIEQLERELAEAERMSQHNSECSIRWKRERDEFERSALSATPCKPDLVQTARDVIAVDKLAREGKSGWPASSTELLLAQGIIRSSDGGKEPI